MGFLYIIYTLRRKITKKSPKSFSLCSENDYLCAKFEDMRPKLTLYSLLFCSIMASAPAYAVETAEPNEPDTVVVSIDSLAIVEKYVQALQAIVYQRDSTDIQDSLASVKLNPYFFQLLSTPTLYNAPMKQELESGDDSISGDPQLRRLQAINKTLAGLYVSHPWLISQTEANLKEQTAIRDDVKDKMKSENNLSDKVAAGTLTPTVDEKIEVKTRRPNFWKLNGSTSLNFTQFYYSDNWAGGENRYTGQTTLNVSANYNDEKRLTWNNNLVMQLGFTTSKTDKRRAFRPTSNLLQYTTNAGLKAIKTWSYTAQVVIKTQIVPQYNPNTDEAVLDIFSPMSVNIAPGMSYSFAYGKKKKFTGNLNIAPLSYNIQYVQRDNLVTRYGVRAGHHSAHSFGPNILLNYTWPITKNVNWRSRIYWFSNLHLTSVDWQNTVVFTINKYLTSTLFVNPVFDDRSLQWKGKHGYLRMQENLALGLTYTFNK